MVWLCAPPSDHDANAYEVPPLDLRWRVDGVLEALELIHGRTASTFEIPSIWSVSPLGTVSNERSTLSGKMKTDDVCVSPSESVTVRTIS